MTKTELIAAVAEAAEITKKDAEKAVNATVEAITKALANGEKVALVGFGTFETRERAAHAGRNPRTKETIQIAAATVPAFKAGQALKDAERAIAGGRVCACLLGARRRPLFCGPGEREETGPCALINTLR